MVLNNPHGKRLAPAPKEKKKKNPSWEMDIVRYLWQYSQALSFLLEASDHENARTLVFFLWKNKKGASFIFRKKDLGFFFFGTVKLVIKKEKRKKEFTIFSN